MTLNIEFLTDLHAKVTVQVESADKLLDVQRQYGKLGWTTGDIPAGGYQFPIDNESDFDWSLIGARKWTNPEGEELIMHKGHAYKRRELEAVDSRKMKLPAAVKYSRGAKSTDPEHVREKADGEFEYVALAVFRGGKRQERYAIPTSSQPQQQRPQQTRERQPEPEAKAEQPRLTFKDAWLGAAGGTHYNTAAGRDEVAAQVGPHLGLNVTTFNELLSLKRADVNATLVETVKAWLAESSKQASD